MQRRYVYQIVAVGLFLLAAWWIYPFFDLRKNPAFNSDSALVVVAATEQLPISENLFQWGGARNGSPLAALGKLFYWAFGGARLLDFLGIADALIFVLGCSTFFSLRKMGSSSLIAVPAGLLVVLPNFHTGISTATFAYTVTDIGHRPEAVPLLVLVSWLVLSLCDRPRWSRHWWGCLLGAAIAGVMAAWVTELALVAGMIFAGIAFLREAIRRKHYPWETIIVALSIIVGVQMLRRISIHGSAENRQLYALVEGDTFHKLARTAMFNLWSTLTPATWVLIIAMFLLVVTVALIRPRLARAFVQERPAWHCLDLLLLGFAALILPLGNNWVFGNGAHPRYFSPGSLLLCIGVAQGAVALMQQGTQDVRKWWFVTGGGLFLLLPIVITGAQTVSIREKLRASTASDYYKASKLIVDSGARGVIGSFWNSYVYVMAAPGSIKATSFDDLKTSRTNTLRVLASSPLAWIEEDPAKLESTVSSRGVEFVPADGALPVALPTRAYFRLYIPKRPITATPD